MEPKEFTHTRPYPSFVGLGRTRQPAAKRIIHAELRDWLQLLGLFRLRDSR